MMATSKKMPEQDPGEIEALLPWRAADRLNPRDRRRVDDAIARDPALARQYALIQEEHAAIIALNDGLGAPSPGVMQKLFAAIDAEPPRGTAAASGLPRRFAGFFAGLSPRALAWSAALAGFALLLQATLIGAMLAWPPTAAVRHASVQPQTTHAPAPITRSLGAAPAPRVFVRFAPDARAAEIAALLDRYRASVIDSSKGGIFKLQFPEPPQQDLTELVNRLRDEQAVSLALPAP
ncbi:MULTISPECIES: hypothetical protein [Rhodopseudomonas]|uniref:Transmembrane anti-sigma factor n=1 Tax=Rhodopseudomonas palustris TaxID=1076 RepID=A0A0D7EIN9_RHOPL|nr:MULTISPECIES: hypothetical protein [Rhodopseudomonas]KIZ40653.1 hypothetical protein OO17_17170 [Rhodopseudomonas palustris]MDF3808964.1 hypothetical protein [Rhodopseudomonas sp. BAL398]WOK20038.1 hypothetical protein RBJ75_11195 [Rhodopseudomonas sp. BAL398]